MSGEGDGFDPCEYVWGHELAMRRLINLLRNSQTLCTDSECFEDGSAPRDSSPDQVLLMSIFFITALFMYYFRPRAQQSEGPSKPSASGNNPPTPPPATN